MQQTQEEVLQCTSAEIGCQLSSAACPRYIVHQSDVHLISTANHPLCIFSHPLNMSSTNAEIAALDDQIRALGDTSKDLAGTGIHLKAALRSFDKYALTDYTHKWDPIWEVCPNTLPTNLLTLIVLQRYARALNGSAMSASSISAHVEGSLPRCVDDPDRTDEMLRLHWCIRSI
jgi:hypothetical protein